MNVYNIDAGTGTLESADEWYDWVGGILNTIYLDATCGKQCYEPIESMGVKTRTHVP
jgi:hypothetical protein